MRIILSPAKKMNIDTDTLEHQGLPAFLDQTKEILDWLRMQSYADLQRLWNCNDKIAEQNYMRVKEMDIYKRLTPAIISYEGIAFQYMAEHQIEDPDDIRSFDRLGCVYREDLSNVTQIVFERGRG